MNLPTCPNTSTGTCARSEIVLVRENERFWTFLCRCCQLDWVVSKPRSKAEGKWRSEIARMERATEAERERLSRPRYFTAPRGGWQ